MRATDPSDRSDQTNPTDLSTDPSDLTNHTNQTDFPMSTRPSCLRQQQLQIFHGQILQHAARIVAGQN